MKKNTIIFGLLILALGFGFASCASLNQAVDGFTVTKMDKASKTNAVLYLDDTVQIETVDGVSRKNVWGQDMSTDGTGTVKTPKAALAIPAGKRELKVTYASRGEGMALTKPFGSFTFDYLAKRCYQIILSTDLYDVKVQSGFDRLTGREHDREYVDAEGAKEAQEAWEAYANTVGLGAAQSSSSPLGAVLGTVQGLDGASPPLLVTIIDITGGKKKNSATWKIVIPHTPKP
jgi:hypothetical protein